MGGAVKGQDVPRGYFLKSVILVFLLLLPVFVCAQVINYAKGTDCNFNSLAEINQGCSSRNYLTLQFSGFGAVANYPAGWSIKVRANGNFSNGSAIIPVQTVSIRFSSANGGPTGVAGTGYQPLNLSSETQLITTAVAISSPPVFYFEHRFDIFIAGGSQLAAGAGLYTTTLTVTLVDHTGKIIASRNDIPISFMVNYSNTCLTLVLGSYSGTQFPFLSYSQEMAGATIADAISIQYNPNSATCLGWSLKVRAAGNFVNGSNAVPPQYFSLRFNRVNIGSPSAAAIGIKNGLVQLGTSEVVVINPSNATFVANTATEHKFDMIIQGGNHLILPNGVYTGNLIFTLYNQSNQVVSTTTVPYSFAIYSTSNGYTVVLQNSASDVDMVFSTPTDYARGVSVKKVKGLKIVGYNAHELIVKTGSSNLQSGTSAEVIPVSAINLEILKNTPTLNGIICYTRPLSSLAQVMISNPLSDYTQQTVEYDLRYFTNPGDNRINKGGGRFSTVVLFVVIPK